MFYKQIEFHILEIFRNLEMLLYAFYPLNLLTLSTLAYLNYKNNEKLYCEYKICFLKSKTAMRLEVRFISAAVWVVGSLITDSNN